MTERIIQRIELDFGKPEGTWTFTRHPDGTSSIGGKPSPSESQAHSFQYVVNAIQMLAAMSLPEIKQFIEGGKDGEERGI